MLSALSKYSLIDSFLASEQKGLRVQPYKGGAVVGLVSVYLAARAVPMDMNRQQQDTGYRIEIQVYKIAYN
uniref:Uncharacterized protein n=1 Tax=Oryza barthii TaxID=65489 RepID=A0A0D3HML0_9ORYZ